MAKKSAKSKGYRKTVSKKPYLSKRDIGILCVLIVIIAVAAILLFSYDDGALKLADGKLTGTEDNWVIVNGANSGGHRYYKLAEAGDMEGYERTTEPAAGDGNLSLIRYTPNAEDAPIRNITLSATHAKSADSAAYYRSIVSSLETSEIQTAQAGDVSYRYFTYRTSYHVDEAEAAEGEIPESADAAETATGPAETAETDAADAAEGDAEETPNRFEQAIHAYVDAAHDSSVDITVVVNAEGEEDFLAEDDLKAYIDQTISALTLEKK